MKEQRIQDTSTFFTYKTERIILRNNNCLTCSF